MPAAKLNPPADFALPAGLLSVEQASQQMLAAARRVEQTEQAPLERAMGRVVANDVVAPIDVPRHAASVMDGFGLRAHDAGRDGGWLPVSQRVAAGNTGPLLAPGSAVRLFTGSPIPPGVDVVVAQEDCEAADGRVRVPGKLSPGDFIRPAANDIACGSVVLAAGTRLGAPQLGVLASLGMPVVEVTRPLKVAVLASGSELVLPGEPLEPGQIYSSNPYVLGGALRALGCQVVDVGRVEDDREATRSALQAAADASDVVVSSGGMSVGEEDHVRHVVEAMGELDLWRVAVKPGKPLAYGRITGADGSADFFGLPGNPVSTLATFCLFVRPFLLCRMGVAATLPRGIPVLADFDWPRPGNRREYARARRVFRDDGTVAAVLHDKQGSDVMSAVAWADGLVMIPEGRSIERGDSVAFLSLAELVGA